MSIPWKNPNIEYPPPRNVSWFKIMVIVLLMSIAYSSCAVATSVNPGFF